ncbi:MAG TPA: hypothetical protein VE959_06135 [Bryobacteraceae bacterium]|nr:hypothetical protein [Bryobacteraceae bacterium]
MKLIKQARAAVSMLDPVEVRKRARRPLNVGLVAPDGEAYGEMEDFLLPAGMSREARLDMTGRVHRVGDADAPPSVDLVMYHRTVARGEGSYTLDPRDPESLTAEIMSDHEELALALARQFPAFRKPVVDRIVQAVARENALFSIATALPNVVPNFMELPWAFGEFASDTAFLTANQIRMAFLIGGACGQEVGFSHQTGAVLSIVAGAFGWRALARELAGKIPLGGGLIPKGAIAYAGTFAVGKSLEFFYHANRHYTREESDQVYRQGFEKGQGVAESLSAGEPPTGSA